MIPSVFIPGYCKCGTTSFVAMLAQHPGVFVPVKEPGFFAHDLHVLNDEQVRRFGVLPSFPFRSLSAYTSLYGDAGSRLCIDASTMYVWSSEALERIKKAVPDAKIILFTRERGSWIRSYYSMMFAAGVERRSFRAAIGNPLRVSSRGSFPRVLDYDFLAPSEGVICSWKNAFSDVLVISYEDFKDDPVSVVSAVASWLGLAPYAFTPLHLKPRERVKVAWLAWLLSSPRMVRFVRAVLPARFHQLILRSVVSRVRALAIQEEGMG